MNDEQKRKSIDELTRIAQAMTREALRGHVIPIEMKKELVLVTHFESDSRIFQLYIPADKPMDARIICQATLDSYSGEGSVEVFLDKYPEGILGADLAVREKKKGRESIRENDGNPRK